MNIEQWRVPFHRVFNDFDNTETDKSLIFLGR